MLLGRYVEARCGGGIGTHTHTHTLVRRKGIQCNKYLYLAPVICNPVNKDKVEEEDLPWPKHNPFFSFPFCAKVESALMDDGRLYIQKRGI